MAKKPKPSPVEDFIALPDAQKELIARRFDREFSLAETQPLSATERKEWARIMRQDRKQRGRPRVGLGAQRVPVSIERGLLHRADAFAKRKGVSRSQLVARGLELALAER